jgi:hypothetical protein
MKQRIFWGLVAAVAIYEFVAIASEEQGDTITEMWDERVKKHGQILPFGLGVVAGHLVWSGRN